MNITLYGRDINTLTRLCQIFAEAGHKTNPKTTKGELVHQEYDVLIWDDEDLSGLKALTERPNAGATIVLTYDKARAFDALQEGANDVLLKPYDAKSLKAALDKVSRLYACHQSALERANIAPVKNHIAARTHKGVTVISLDDIYHFTADQKYVKVRHKNGIVLIDETLKEIERQFGGRIFRIHRNAIINLDHLDLLEKTDKGQYQVRLRGLAEPLAVSRRHLPALREKIHSI